MRPPPASAGTPRRSLARQVPPCQCPPSTLAHRDERDRHCRSMKRLLVCALATVAMLSSAGASAAVGPGTFTRITTPGADVTVLVADGSVQVGISGITSFDVTTVDIDCL